MPLHLGFSTKFILIENLSYSKFTPSKPITAQ